MLDVHVLVMPDSCQEWLGQCIASVTHAAAQADFPVHVHVLPAHVGHVGKGREAGYRCGSQPYVAYVDDDDYVFPHAFACLKPAMESGTAAVFAREIQEQNGVQWPSDFRHNGWACRRDVLDGFDFAAHPYFVDVETRALAARHPDGVIDVPEHVYLHRVRIDSPARLLQRRLALG